MKTSNPNSGFNTPKGYFDSIDQRIMDKWKFHDRMASSNAHGHRVPDNYFETLDDKVAKRLLEEQKVKVVPLFSRPSLRAIASIAAVVLIAFVVFMNRSNNDFESLDVVLLEDYIYESNLHTNDLVELLPNEIYDELSLTLGVEEQQLESFMIDELSVEDLIIE